DVVVSQASGDRVRVELERRHVAVVAGRVGGRDTELERDDCEDRTKTEQNAWPCGVHPGRVRSSIFRSRSSFTRGQLSSTIAYQAESRIESGSTMCLWKMPSNVAPMPSSAPRARRLRDWVAHST